MPKQWAKVRSWVLLICGLTGVGHEVISAQQRPILLVLFAVMMGAPGVEEMLDRRQKLT